MDFFEASQELGCLRVSKHPGASRTLGEVSGEILALFLAGEFFLLIHASWVVGIVRMGFCCESRWRI